MSLQAELEKEAGIMAALDSPYIIRMIGLCKSDWMLILEYAPLGPLKDYLRLHKRFTLQPFASLFNEHIRPVTLY